MDAANEFALVNIGNLSGCLLRHPVAVRVKGDAPIQKETQFWCAWMSSRFITTNSPLGMDFNSSGVMSARSIICKDWLLSFP